MIHVSNHGPLLIRTNFWDTELSRAGKVFCSVNAGAIRVLLPPARYADLAEMRTSRYCVLSRGPWPAQRRKEAIELLWEDGTDTPYVLTLTPESFDLLPREPDAGREWTVAVYVTKDGAPHRALERICHWRRVARIPWLKPWERTQ